MSSRSSCSRSRAASTLPAGWGTDASSNARTTWRSASDSRGRRSVPGRGIDDVAERSPGPEAPEVVTEEVDAAVQDPGRRPGCVRRHHEVRDVPERRARPERLLAEHVERRATDPTVAQGPD